jgi:hypothetical protein
LIYIRILFMPSFLSTRLSEVEVYSTSESQTSIRSWHTLPCNRLSYARITERKWAGYAFRRCR